MKKVEGYLCSGCSSLYTDEQTALQCEKDHVNYKELRITDAWYNKRFLFTEHGENKELKENTFVPNEIRILYKEKEKDGYFTKSFIAFYQLKRFEYKEDDREK